VIYVDSSVVVAELLAEDRHPDAAFWDDDTLVSSRLTEYEVWNAINAHGLGASHGADVRELFARLAFLELDPTVIARALEPFPVRVRTLDALHLASMAFLDGLGQGPALATYDARLADAATAMGFQLVPL
jgi:uncharacterized protein